MASGTTLQERVAAFSVARRADANYTETEFVCPTVDRRYLSVKRPIAYTTSVAAACYWCDVYGRKRTDSAFDAGAPQCHVYPLDEVRQNGHAAEVGAK
jgi:hypothetical protein